jgi:hypothetical protein
VNKKIIEAIPGIISGLSQIRISNKTAFFGFDACIDNIVRVVSDRHGIDGTDFFSDSNQLGEFLTKLDNKSCGIELKTKLSKTGGNMVITANALGNLGINIECVGTFGMPGILPVFKTMSANCTLHTIADTITATALEFDNSKVIMFDPGPYNNLTWEGIKDILGVEKIKEMLSGKQLISFVNWSEIENSSKIWKGILDEILPEVDFRGSKPFFFTDFSDCSRKSKDEIRSALDLLDRFRDYFSVNLSLNQNEAALIARALDLPDLVSDNEFINALYKLCNSDVLVIHRVNDAIAYDGSTFEQCDTFFCEEPMILTGGGDNFNAGYCFSLFIKFDLFQSLLVANAVSGSYVKTGISPDVDHLIEFLDQELK